MLWFSRERNREMQIKKKKNIVFCHRMDKMCLTSDRSEFVPTPGSELEGRSRENRSRNFYPQTCSISSTLPRYPQKHYKQRTCRSLHRRLILHAQGAFSVHGVLQLAANHDPVPFRLKPDTQPIGLPRPPCCYKNRKNKFFFFFNATFVDNIRFSASGTFFFLFSFLIFENNEIVFIMYLQATGSSTTREKITQLILFTQNL